MARIFFNSAFCALNLAEEIASGFVKIFDGPIELEDA